MTKEVKDPYGQCIQYDSIEMVDYNRDTITKLAVEQADALIEELKRMDE